MQNVPVKIINRLPHSERLRGICAIAARLSAITAGGNIRQELLNNIKCLQDYPSLPVRAA
jgi:hypothetical protein